MVRERLRSIQYINKLRILAIYAVVTGHVAIWTTYDAAPQEAGWWIGTWIHLVCLCAIPVFVMISGALLLDDSRNESAWLFYKKRMFRVGIPLVFWTAFYLVMRVVLDKEEMTAGRAATLIVTADPYYHLWFLCMIPGLYVITPALRVFVRNSTPKQRILLIFVIFLLAGIYSPVNRLFLGNKRTIFTMFLPYTAYFLAGYEIRLADPKKVPFKYLLAALGICAVYVAVLAYPFIDVLGQARTSVIGGTPQFVYDSFCFPQVVMGIGIFWAVYLVDQRTKPLTGVGRTLMEWMASTTLGIYVLHPLVLSFMRYKFSDESAEGGFLFSLTVGPLVAFIISYLIASLIINIPVLRRTIT